MSSAPIFVTRNGAARAYQERDYRTLLNRLNHPKPDAFLLLGKRTVPLYLINSEEPSKTKE